MSAGDINTLTTLWAATLVPHGASPPFDNHTDLYNTIDSTPLGDVPWENFSLQYNGDIPAGETPSWMNAKYKVWFRDPKELVQNLLANPNFKDEFDSALFQEYDVNDKHRFQDFMSGDWAWKQAVSSNAYSANHTNENK